MVLLKILLQFYKKLFLPLCTSLLLQNKMIQYICLEMTNTVNHNA